MFVAKINIFGCTEDNSPYFQTVTFVYYGMFDQVPKHAKDFPRCFLDSIRSEAFLDVNKSH